ncbi:MBL fold metallo-hydrolase RNA specificity domain-containing protein [Daejeonella lutea]|uniref:Metallo-beta-lactamase family protein n=1 Tax=Daejeonella lutea TaxID=572036 RepID=A0A1T5CWG9_9SPHI|nr:MBL fold metallo-hydrolase [Daejeonella lutea]SKB63865.1 metallo-beta-lactamase family protein [Daejeonella lutea]
MNHSIILQSLGAAGTVTGSKHLLKTPGLNILVDCGLFQGIKSLREQNWQLLPLAAGDIDVLILTHAHLDHSGYIPLLVKSGFRGKIFMSQPTSSLTKLILLDSAKIQEEDSERANRFRYTRHKPALPLYTVRDAERSFEQFVTVGSDERIQLSDAINFRFKLSGHILGACSVELNCYGKTIVFSGDIGRVSSPVLETPDYFTSADYVIMESTYGDKLHGAEDATEELAEVINETIQLKGNILIPSFAVGRAQELLYLITKLKDTGKIPVNIPVFLDSPMAAQATDITLQYPEFSKIDRKAWLDVKQHVTINRDFRNTRDIIEKKGSKIIVAASGMLSGGRVLEYMKHYVGDRRNVILLMGYQAEGTRGRALQNQSPDIKIHGQYYPVKARVKEIGSLSAHADQSELLHWLSKFNQKPALVMLVHGEPCAQEALRVKIQDTFHLPVSIMQQNQDVTLFVPEGVSG